MARSERWRVLRVVMNLIAGTLLLAMFAIVMPRPWMETISDWTQVGPFPPQPLVGYLARQTSSLYALHGAMLAIVAMQLPRTLALVVPIGLATVVFAIIALGIDLGEGMPLYWTVLEFAGTLSGGLALVVLGRWAAMKPTDSER